MATTLNYRFRIRRATAAQWTTSDEVLLDSEFGLESDTRQLKIGDGVTPWTSLPYYFPSGGNKPITGLFVNSSGTPLTGTINGTPVWVPYDFTIREWFMGGDGVTTGSGTIDVQTSSDQAAWASITAADIPQVSGAASGFGSSLTGWTTSFVGGIWVRFVGSAFSNWSSASLILSVSTP